MKKLRMAAAILIAAAALPAAARAELPRRICAEARLAYFMLDSNFFGLDDALGIDAAFRYELFRDIYFENSIGFFSTEGSGVNVRGLDYQLGLVAVFPVLIPYRPTARFGAAVISVNPVTVTPTQSFRPTQTTFYLTGGAGVTRSIFDNVLLQADAAFWITPYRYRIYRFDRYKVATRDERFAHLRLSLGAVYTF